MVESSYCSWQPETRGRGPEKETGRKGKGGRARGVRVVIDGGERAKGRAMAGKEEGRQQGGRKRGMKCVPGSQLQASPVVLGRV